MSGKVNMSESQAQEYDKNTISGSRSEIINPHDYIGLLNFCAHMMISGKYQSQNPNVKTAIFYNYRAHENGSLTEFGDLVNQGYLGLVQAAKKFDTSRGVEFHTYALPRIVNMAGRTVLNRVFMPISMPIGAFNRYIQDNKPLPSCVPNDLVPDSEGDKVKDLRYEYPGTGLKIAPRFDVADSTASADLDKVDDTQYVMQILESSGLTEQQKQLVMDRFGFSTGKPMTLRECGLARGLTKQAIQHREQIILKKLRLAAGQEA